jgi:hypothetical protein
MKQKRRAIVATLLSLGFFCTLALSVSPQLHHRVHPDANHADHVCAVTFVASGSYEHSAQPSLVTAPGLAQQLSEIPTLRSVWVPSLFLVAHIFAHAPPAR